MTAEQPSRNPVAPLLESLGHEHLDPGYAEAAERKRTAPGRPPGRSRRALVLPMIGCLIAGLVLGVAAWRTDSNQPRAENTRAALLEDEVSRNDRALELKRHLRRREEALRRADVVQEAREVVRLAVVRPAREVGLHERGACSARGGQHTAPGVQDEDAP